MSTTASPTPKLFNGAYCNQFGAIYLRVVSMDADWKDKAVDHGISVQEAHCIAADLMVAIQEASRLQTGRMLPPESPCQPGE